LRISQQAGRTSYYSDLEVHDAKVREIELRFGEETDEVNERTLEASDHKDYQRGSGEHELSYCSTQQRWFRGFGERKEDKNLMIPMQICFLR